FLAVERVLETGGDVGNFGEEDREQEHVRDVDLPDPAQDPRGRHHEAGLQHRAAIDKGGGVAGDEDEDFGGVGKSVIADREPGQDIGRQMIDEDQPQRHAAKQVEPQFALAGPAAAAALLSLRGVAATGSAMDDIWHRWSGFYVCTVRETIISARNLHTRYASRYG